MGSASTSASASPTILTPYGYSSGTCGYCSPSGQRSRGKTSSKYGMVTEQMTPEFYQLLVDRGWRRSGDYLYHPDMARTCCPQYTIRLNTTTFKATKKHRQVVNRFNRYLETGQKPGESSTAVDDSTRNAAGKDKGKGKGKGKNNSGKQDILDELHSREVGYIPHDEEVHLAHSFKTQLVPAQATKETFELYKAYQIAIHKDKPETVTMRGFDRFLCGSTLIQTPINHGTNVDEDLQHGRLPRTYGQYHLLYKVDDVLIGISVIDILPSCVSSVYFIWHPDWAWASLGKLSALYEISLSRRMREKGVKDMKWVYMGYWIPDCQKMKYKSEYAPSELLDPGTNTFYPLDTILETFLVSHPTGYHPFSNVTSTPFPDTSLTQDIPIGPTNAKRGDAPEKAGPNSETGSESDTESEEEAPSSWPDPTPPGFEDPSRITDEAVELVFLLFGRNRFTGKGGKLIPISNLEFRDAEVMYREIKEFLAAVGQDNIAALEGGVAEKAVLYLG
ncbi:uncharacterized protein I303_102047 [Kwoniella dejecticola CBS 10117]|uniref:arginyltransferase n=1 Tax=Kwoniella dejecticola CBS 10117 TaxID=1296121 RepID=A0A1A6AC10_9TREE|nr:uncharacterized protein I303_01814 [Kwoniella dejecticola CBS 10117]OBR87606.1 hypothetical protein I303_01814 [Kwoniella dejecticola CBS 10117]